MDTFNESDITHIHYWA